MKCENCGKNEVAFVYESNINGKITQKHLCSECAEKLGYTQAIAAQGRRMFAGMENFLNGGFFGGGLLDGFFSPRRALPGGMDSFFGEDPFDDFFTEMPALSAAPARQEQKPAPAESLVDSETQGRFARTRQLNALRSELRRAVHQEEFERAAQLRDQIRALEKERGEMGKSE